MKTIMSRNYCFLVLSSIGLVCLTAFTFQLSPTSTVVSITRHPQRISSQADSTKLYLPDDLQATLWAESPAFYNPTSLDIDARGRVWLTEAIDQQASTNRAEGARIIILEDSDGDGQADKSKVFVQDPDLRSPMGIAVVGNRIIVSCAPNLVVYSDENGDDVPDKKEIMLTGFGGADSDRSLHSVVAGPDGKYYFNVGAAGPHVVTDKDGWTLRSGSPHTSGTPYNKVNQGSPTSDDGRTWVGGLVLRINPDGSALKVMAHNFRNNYKTVVDSYGTMWQNDNDDDVTAYRLSGLTEGANAGFFSADGTRSWKIDQRPGQPAAMARWHQEDPGVLPVEAMTGVGSPTGMVMDEGDELGAPYRGLLLSADASRNAIVSYKPEPIGAGFRLNRTDLISSSSETDPTSLRNMASNDARKWFRPRDIAVGTEGALYIINRYDPIGGGHQSSDRQGNGRIYRITPKGKQLRTPKIDLRNTQGQLAALLSPAVNVRVQGFNALREQGEQAVAPVMALLTSPNQYHRARAIFLLAQLGAEGQFEVERLLKAVDAPIRLVALRALRSITPENSKSNPGLTASQKALLPLLGNLSTDRNAAVRCEVAVALRDVPYDECRLMLLNLVKGYDGQDRWYLNALGEAADGKEDALFFDLRQTMPENPDEWDQRTANLIWELHPSAAVTMLKKRAESPSLTAAAQQQAITTLGFIKTQPAAKAMVELARSTNKEVATQANYWLALRRNNDWATFLDWSTILPTHASASEEKMLAKRNQLLDENRSDSEKRKIATDMSRDVDGAKLLIGLAADGKLSEELIKAAGPGIRTNKDQTVRVMGKEYFPWKRPIPNAGESMSVTSAQPVAQESMVEAAKPTAEPIKTPPVSTVPVQAVPAPTDSAFDKTVAIEKMPAVSMTTMGSDEAVTHHLTL